MTSLAYQSRAREGAIRMIDTARRGRRRLSTPTTDAGDKNEIVSRRNVVRKDSREARYGFANARARIRASHGARPITTTRPLLRHRALSLGPSGTAGAARSTYIRIRLRSRRNSRAHAREDILRESINGWQYFYEYIDNFSEDNSSVDSSRMHRYSSVGSEWEART